MKILQWFIFAFVLVFSTAESIADSEPDAEVLLFGVFHFANPGKDVVKTNQINVMTAENQQFLEGLTDRLAAFKPTVVLLEFNPNDESLIQEKYEEYLAGAFELPSNEIYQLGFRIAKKAGLSTVYSFDEREIGWQAEALFAYMPDHDPATKAKMDLLIEQITSETQKDHATKSLSDLLLLGNDPERDQLNKFSYIMTNHVGAGENFVGADAAASWWHRNFRMYANIQKHAAPGTRVLAIGGQGHTAILKDMLALDRERVAVDVRPYVVDQ